MHLPYIILPSVDLSRFGLGRLDWFAVFVLLAIVVGVTVYDRAVARGGNLDARTARLLPEVVVVGGLIGAHLVHVLAYHPELMQDDPWVLLKVWAGISSVGGFVGGALALVLWLCWRRQPFLPYADRIVFGLAVGWVLGRVGCATSHDHPGRKSDFLLAVQFPDGPRHDLGLYELVLTLVVVVPVMLWLVRKPWRSGTVLGAWLVLYGVSRFFLDLLRADDLSFVDPRYRGLTPAQYVAVAMTIAGAVALVRRPVKPLQPPLWGQRSR